jgi:hypothetical protein
MTQRQSHGKAALNVFRDTMSQMVSFLKEKGPLLPYHQFQLWRNVKGGWKPKTIEAP